MHWPKTEKYIFSLFNPVDKFQARNIGCERNLTLNRLTVGKICF